MASHIMITGSEGLVGRAVAAALEAEGVRVRRFDLQASGTDQGDIRDRARLDERLQDCRGVVHLAAISRVGASIANPARCRSINVDGTAQIVDAAMAQGAWVLFSSSREVYGEPERLPVKESASVCPVNIYGHSKAEAERILLLGRQRGLRCAIVRLANVYGGDNDHPDRALPAFARAAATGAVMELHGASNMFDFTHIADVTRGLLCLIERLETSAAALPTIHLVSGRGTSLRQLAALANAAGGRRSAVIERANRANFVSRFVGDPKRACNLLGWRTTIRVEEGIRQLVQGFMGSAATGAAPSAARPLAAVK